MAQSGFSLHIVVTDHSEEALREFAKAVKVGLTKCGVNMERYAKQWCPVRTGRLHGSIVHELADDGRAVYVGTNVYYAPYVEMGTSKHPKPQPFIEPAVVAHKDEHKNTIMQALQGTSAIVL